MHVPAPCALLSYRTPIRPPNLNQPTADALPALGRIDHDQDRELSGVPPRHLEHLRHCHDLPPLVCGDDAIEPVALVLLAILGTKLLFGHRDRKEAVEEFDQPGVIGFGLEWAQF